MAIETNALPPTINLERPGEGFDLDYIPNVAREARVSTVMSNGFGFGGHNASLLIGRCSRTEPGVLRSVFSWFGIAAGQEPTLGGEHRPGCARSA
ncbi:MAG: hypothetical protein U0790_07030 [Isosphaeraceae bacterium]